MSLNINKEDSDHLSKLQEQNGEEYKHGAEEIEDSRTNRKKRKVEETYPLMRFTSAWLFIIRVYKL